MMPDMIITEQIVVYGATAISFIFLMWKFIHPINRDRWLYAERGINMLFYSALWLVLCIGVIYFAVQVVSRFDSEVPNNLVRNPDAPNQLEYASKPEGFALIWSILCQFMDPGNLPLASGNVSRVLALICAFAGVICLSGLLVSSFVSRITRKAQQWRDGEIYYNNRFFRKYVVVIGTNEQAATIIKDALKRGDVKYVLVQTRKEVKDARQQLWLKLNESEEKKVVFFSGERTSYEDIKRLRLEKAVEVFILGEEMAYENEQDHDSFNINCLELISKYMKGRPKGIGADNSLTRLRCHVALEYQSTYTVFKSTHIYSTLDETVEFLPFNIHEIWAKKVLVDNYAVIPVGKTGESHVQRYLPLDSDRGICKDSENTVHLVIMGMNQMGTALAMQAAMLMHYPNFESGGNLRHSTITFIDDQAVKEGEFLMGRFSSLFELAWHRTVTQLDDLDSDSGWIDPLNGGRYSHLAPNFMDIKWEFIEGNVASKKIQQYLSGIADDKKKLCTIAVCFNDPQQSMATALYLPEAILKGKAVKQILVYQRNSFDMVDKVATGEKQWKRFAKLRPFGATEGCYKGDIFDNVLAKAAYRLFTLKTEDKLLQDVSDETIVNLSRLWNEQGIVNKLSNINFADSIPVKLRSLGSLEYDTENIDPLTMRAMANAEHNRWLTERLTLGFRPLDKQELAKLESFPSVAERKREKERCKAKYRGHLDICSNTMLDVVEPELKHSNDEKMIRNISRLLKLENKILVRQILTDKKAKNNQLPVSFLSNMIFIEGEDVSGSHIKSFWMGAEPVTQKQWIDIMGETSNPSSNKVRQKDRYPVEMVSKDMIEDFLYVLRDKTGLKFRLPTFQEWEYAAKGGNTHDKTIYGQVWCCSERRIPVGTTIIGSCNNSLELQDIVGNVWEWTSSPDDTYSSTYRFCGGSWRFGVEESSLLSDKWYSYWKSEFRSPDLGFRLVLSFDFKKDDTPMKMSFVKERDNIIGKMEGQMVFVEGGKVVVKEKEGATESEVPSFYIAEAPVTQRQWMAVMGADKNPSKYRGELLPVENVDFSDAMAFINKLNTLQHVFRYRLPSEEEWEYVAKGGKMHNCSKYAGSDDAESVAWFYENARSTREIRRKKGVVIGGKSVYDLCGNVWEWCSSPYYKTAEEEKTDSQKGVCTSRTKVMRGGSWRFDAEECLVTSRTYWIEEYKSDDLGFRLAADKIE